MQQPPDGQWVTAPAAGAVPVAGSARRTERDLDSADPAVQVGVACGQQVKLLDVSCSVAWPFVGRPRRSVLPEQQVTPKRSRFIAVDVDRPGCNRVGSGASDGCSDDDDAAATPPKEST